MKVAYSNVIGYGVPETISPLAANTSRATLYKARALAKLNPNVCGLRSAMTAAAAAVER